MTPLLIATSNAGKLREIRDILRDVPFALRTLADLLPIAEPDETGATFEANALLKARYYAGATGLLTVADDSGLEVDALDGAPGVMSARFPGATYEEKFATMFAMLDAKGVETSAARFVCALALVRGDEVVFEARGVVEGEITRRPRGRHGFGYDPIFYHPPFDLTLAEVPLERKREVSHRGKAFEQLRTFLGGSSRLLA
ncbi:MAG: RdgB/HAM1 family non-canonical purine NTP pyrophosphatase [Acidobacteria bacterium]|nr:RdgB/HAM1 family non-canonical purine NTP pyrophosphatase [Acidobacteriota bacterium]